MARQPRTLPESAMLHIICRSNNGMRLFHENSDFERFLGKLEIAAIKAALFIHHYILMHTHVHILAWTDRTDLLASAIKSVTISHHHYYALKYGYRGHLWHSRYRSILIENEPHWFQCGRYIELNADHAGICDNPADYQWSSYHYYAKGVTDTIVRPIMHYDKDHLWRPGVENHGYCEFVLAGKKLDYLSQKELFEDISPVGDVHRR